MTRQLPWKSACKQAGGIIAASVVAALAFNAVPPTKVPWIRETPKFDTVSVEDLLRNTPAPVDTLASHSTPSPADTAAAQQRSDTAAQAHADSVAAKRAAKDTAGQGAGSGASSTTQSQTSTAAAIPKGIGTDAALRIFREKKALFIDARPSFEFVKGHIPGAINVYANEFEPHIPDLLHYPMDTLVVAYCGGGLCELSHDLADQLTKLGFKRVVVYTGGTTDWTAKNLPFTEGE